jgi:hypothetical protein
MMVILLSKALNVKNSLTFLLSYQRMEFATLMVHLHAMTLKYRLLSTQAGIQLSSLPVVIVGKSLHQNVWIKMAKLMKQLMTGKLG